MNTLEDTQGTLITGSAFLSYTTCIRQAWLTLHRFSPESQNEYLMLGDYIHKTTFSKAQNKEIELPGAKLDMIWEKSKMTIVGEIKKSSKSIKGARIQLLYYLKLLKERGIEAAGEIIIPNEHRRLPIKLTASEEQELLIIENELVKLGTQDKPPKPKRIRLCSKCGYNHYCWS